LVAFKLYSRLAEWATDCYEGELCERLRTSAT